jgi:hypothetical protein
VGAKGGDVFFRVAIVRASAGDSIKANLKRKNYSVLRLLGTYQMSACNMDAEICGPAEKGGTSVQ